MSAAQKVSVMPSEGTWSPYDRVAFHPYRVHFVAKETVRAPRDRLPNMLRGAFELAFRRLVCHDIDLDCRTCPLRDVCPYPGVFRPSPQVGAERLSKQSDLPRPFVFEPPPDTPSTLPAGEALDLGLNLFGTTNRFLPYVVVALRAVAERGLGHNRGKLELQTLTAITPGGECSAYDADQSRVSIVNAPYRLSDLRDPADDIAEQVHIQFLTPTTIKRDGLLVEQPSFSDIVRRARDRLSAIATFFGDGPIEVNFAELGHRADEVQAIEVNTAWVQRTRRSSRTGAVHQTSGFVGDATYQGQIGPFMPVLRAAEMLHVGKYAVWGNGKIVIRTRSQRD